MPATAPCGIPRRLKEELQLLTRGGKRAARGGRSRGTRASFGAAPSSEGEVSLGVASKTGTFKPEAPTFKASEVASAPEAPRSTVSSSEAPSRRSALRKSLGVGCRDDSSSEVEEGCRRSCVCVARRNPWLLEPLLQRARLVFQRVENDLRAAASASEGDAHLAPEAIQDLQAFADLLSALACPSPRKRRARCSVECVSLPSEKRASWDRGPSRDSEVGCVCSSTEARCSPPSVSAKQRLAPSTPRAAGEESSSCERPSAKSDETLRSFTSVHQREQAALKETRSVATASPLSLQKEVTQEKSAESGALFPRPSPSPRAAFPSLREERSGASESTLPFTPTPSAPSWSTSASVLPASSREAVPGGAVNPPKDALLSAFSQETLSVFGALDACRKEEGLELIGALSAGPLEVACDASSLSSTTALGEAPLSLGEEGQCEALKKHAEDEEPLSNGDAKEAEPLPPCEGAEAGEGEDREDGELSEGEVFEAFCNAELEESAQRTAALAPSPPFLPQAQKAQSPPEVPPTTPQQQPLASDPRSEASESLLDELIAARPLSAEPVLANIFSLKKTEAARPQPKAGAAQPKTKRRTKEGQEKHRRRWAEIQERRRQFDRRDAQRRAEGAASSPFFNDAPPPPPDPPNPTFV